MGIDYKSAGVDVEAGYKAVSLMKEYVKKTYDKNVIGDIGSFGGFYALGDKPDSDVLVAGTDGVGTKLKYAFILDKHDTVGIDCVAMCVNDIVCQGAKPLLFLDYIATGKLIPEKIAQIVKGVSEGCVQAGCALIGGETAEMPGFYGQDDYDMAGFSVGIAKRNKVINGKTITEDDVLVGLASSGIHSNGYSLVRKLFGEDKKELLKFIPELNAAPADILLEPTRIYVKSILSLIDNSYEVPAVFKYMQKKASIDNSKIYNTFNMGIGMVAAVSKNDANDVCKFLNDIGEKAYIIGKTVKGEGVIL